MKSENITKQLKHIEIRLRPYLYADDINAIQAAIHEIEQSKNMVDDLKEIYQAIYDVDIPSPTVPEYREHHEQMQSLMALVIGMIHKRRVGV